MKAAAANAFRHFVSTLVVVCVSVCCCQAQILTHGLTDASARGPVAETAAPSCCSGQCPSETGSDSDEPATPMRGCRVCCIKGSGLQTGPTLDLSQDVVALPPMPALVETLDRPASRVIAPEAAPPFVAPPTLLRLRCALVV
ncbi:MAG: hypothetical protein GY715_09885 [Planctomycetes bacterium]|nr:hypothetical protein [Planctomycetota bacterium]